MSSLAAFLVAGPLVFATPVFGFALTPPDGVLPSPPPGSLLRVPILAQLGDAEEGSETDAVDEGAPDPDEADEADAAPSETAELPAVQAEDDGPTEMEQYASQLRERQELGSIHRALGIATWASMLITNVLGAIQFHNLYGGGGGLEDTPCVQGNAVFGQEQCWGTAWPHRIAAIATTALYTTTFAFSLFMPDPDNAAEGDSAFAQNLRIHKALRWVHLVGMVAQVFLGIASASNLFGLDRANDFEAQQALAGVHMGVGLATFAALTAAGALMVF